MDQAHRGYYVAEDGADFRSVNPLYMAYAPDHDGNFNGACIVTINAHIPRMNEV